MTATLVAHNNFAFSDGGSPGHVCDFGSAPSVGQLDVLGVISRATVSTPASSGAAWSLRTSNVGNAGGYLFSRKATGGEASTVTIVTSVSVETVVLWGRFGLVNAFDTTPGTLKATVDNSGASATPALSTGALGATNELAVAFAGLTDSISGQANTPVWSAGYTALEFAAQGTAGTANAVAGFLAYRLDAGTAAETPALSWSGGGYRNRYLFFGAWSSLAGTTYNLSGDRSITCAPSGTISVSHPAAAVATGGNWYDLIAIGEQNKAFRREDASRPRRQCPNDGTLLEEGPGGQLHCPFDGWIGDRRGAS